jgi:phosphoglycerate dehydrogenase-like enzyme
MLPFDPSRLTVTNASGIHGETMATYVMATVVHMIWDFPRLLRQQQNHQWIKYQVPSLAGLTIGIVGAGHVGQRIGERARTFGMRVIGTRRRAGVIEGFDVVRGPEGLHDVLSESDITVVTLPLTAETRGMLGRRELRSIKAGGWLVNVSRGGIVHEDSLLEVLREGHLAGAVVDVFAREPLPPDSPFWDMSNVLVTPHISSEFAGWPGAVARLFLKNLDLWMRRMPLLNVVNPSRGY